jgi:hypothetical protein
MTRKAFPFEDFAALCPADDIERFRDDYDVYFDMSGTVYSHTVGFHFSFPDDDPAGQAKFFEMANLFEPVAIWTGNEKVHQQLTERFYYPARRFSFFEDGGFMVVLKVPVARQRES